MAKAGCPVVSQHPGWARDSHRAVVVAGLFAVRSLPEIDRSFAVAGLSGRCLVIAASAIAAGPFSVAGPGPVAVAAAVVAVAGSVAVVVDSAAAAVAFDPVAACS